MKKLLVLFSFLVLAFSGYCAENYVAVRSEASGQAETIYLCVVVTQGGPKCLSLIGTVIIYRLTWTVPSSSSTVRKAILGVRYVRSCVGIAGRKLSKARSIPMALTSYR